MLWVLSRAVLHVYTLIRALPRNVLTGDLVDYCNEASRLLLPTWVIGQRELEPQDPQNAGQKVAQVLDASIGSENYTEVIDFLLFTPAAIFGSTGPAEVLFTYGGHLPESLRPAC